MPIPAGGGTVKTADQRWLIRLLHPLSCANLVFCADVCAERKCVRAPVDIDGYFGHPDWLFPGGFRVDWAGVAQLVEHLICNQRVGGSNPFASSTLRKPESGPGTEELRRRMGKV